MREGKFGGSKGDSSLKRRANRVEERVGSFLGNGGNTSDHGHPNGGSWGQGKKIFEQIHGIPAQGRCVFAQGRRFLSPGCRVLSPECQFLSPERSILSPGRCVFAQGRRFLSRDCGSPHGVLGSRRLPHQGSVVLPTAPTGGGDDWHANPRRTRRALTGQTQQASQLGRARPRSNGESQT